MSVVQTILRMWRKPVDTARQVVGSAGREDQALITLITGCFICFLSSLPATARDAHFAGESMARPGTYAFVAWMIVWPLVLYVLAGVTALILPMMGWRGTGIQARMGLFWALLASSPVLLFYGVLRGYLGPETGVTIVGGLWWAAFLVFWIVDLWKGVDGAANV